MTLKHYINAYVHDDDARDPDVAGEITRNGANLMFHDGTSAKQILLAGGAGATEYVVRDCTAYDFDEGDLTTDGAWHADGLDLSAILPASAIAADLEIKIEDDATSYLHIRRDATNTLNRILMTIPVANIAMYQVARIAVNSDRLLDYLASNVTFTSIGIAVVGYVKSV